METKELVFNVINNLSYPIILLEKTKENEWSKSYLNEKMKAILESSSNNQESDVNKESLQKLIDGYNEKERSDSYILSDIEIFDALYNIYFNHSQNYVLIIFIQIPIKELFNNITFHDLSAACSSIIVILDSNGNTVDTNECFLNLVGMTKEAVLEKDFFEMFMSAYKEKLAPYLQEIITKDIYTHHFVTPLIGLDSKQYRINWQVSKIVKSNQIFIIAVGSDITKFIEQNSDLKRRLTTIKVGFDYFPLAIGYMNASGKFIMRNPRFNKLFCAEATDEKIMYNEITPLAKYISFEKLKEYIGLIKEMSFYLDNQNDAEQHVRVKVDIRLLKAKKESSKLYIVVAQNIK